jgi:hypothetical protein
MATVAGVFKVHGGKRWFLAACALGLAVAGTAGVVQAVLADRAPPPDARAYLDNARACLTTFFLGTFAYGFVANALGMARPRG